jgi:hypothetical protein
MTIFVASRPVPHVGALSEPGRLALRFIDGGPHWLDWAAHSATANYDFPDETALLAEVQQGLHASPLTLLPRLELMVSPVKLMTLSTTDLHTIASAEAGDESSVIAVQTRKILGGHSLLTRADLAAGKAFLAEVGVADAPMFQCMGIDDYLAICQLMQLLEGQNAQNPELSREAAAFGVEQGRTPAEFVDYYKCFLHLIAKLEMLGTTATRRAQAVEEALQVLLPLLFGALDCPDVGGLVAPAEVGRAVSAWLARGRRIGFSRLSDGVQQIIRYTEFKNETGDAAQDIVNRYLSAAQAFLATVKLERGEMRQDGASCVFPLKSGEQEAELQLDSAGNVTLRRYQGPAKSLPKPPPLAVERTARKERVRRQRPRNRKLRSKK